MVYGIQCGEFIKIGVATHIERRLKTMVLYNPMPLKIVLRRQPMESYWMEKRMHVLLAEHSVGREWFRITPEKAREVYAAALEDYKVYAKEQREWILQCHRREIEREVKRGTANV